MAGERARLKIRRIKAAITFLLQRTRIVSYPNSGRTWLRVMLAELGLHPRFTHAQSRFRWALPPQEIGQNMSRYTHRRVLFLVRNPKDTVASNYHHVTKRGRHWQGEFKVFLRHPNYGFERILAFHKAWLNAQPRFRHGIHVEFYEDMRADTAETLARIVSFLNTPSIPPAEITASAERNQLEQMKAREISGELHALFQDRFRVTDANEPLARQVRRGRVGGHCEDMDDEDIAYCDSLIAAYGYDAMIATLRSSRQ
jgi:hypothetical protein